MKTKPQSHAIPLTVPVKIGKTVVEGIITGTSDPRFRRVVFPALVGSETVECSAEWSLTAINNHLMDGRPLLY